KQLIIFYGEEAAGKGTFYDLILFPLFEGYITKILGKKLKSSFNGFMSKNLVLVLEEVKADKDEEDTLKELVTEDKILINEKNRSERYENNYLTLFGFSNEQNPISAGKRRGVYFRSRTLGGSTQKAPIFRVKYEENIPKEFDDFLTLLKNRVFDTSRVMCGVQTDAKQQVLDQNKSVIERFFDNICCFPSLSFYIDELIALNKLDVNYDLKKNLYQYKEISYIDANFLLFLYNQYLKENKYNQITLNKFSEFWQLLGIDRDDKTHWRRLTPENKKIQFVNLEKINEEIARRYAEDE
ncbi:MAG: primase-helicase family protein, partial [Candidatus Thorarchaeota archaeon]